MKLRVKNWSHFQHYKDRNPPWIKLHFALLSSKDWVTLDDASRVLAIACMLVASRNEGEIDGSEAGLAYLQRVAYLNKKPNLKPLIDCGFLESASNSASNALADARPETETENLIQTEVHVGASAPPSAPDDSPVVETLPLRAGGQFEVRQAFLAELEPLYPQVDVVTTVREMKGWLLGNPQRQKTRSGAKRFITSWLQREQEKANGAQVRRN